MKRSFLCCFAVLLWLSFFTNRSLQAQPTERRNSTTSDNIERFVPNRRKKPAQIPIESLNVEDPQDVIQQLYNIDSMNFLKLPLAIRPPHILIPEIWGQLSNEVKVLRIKLWLKVLNVWFQARRE